MSPLGLRAIGAGVLLFAFLGLGAYVAHLRERSSELNRVQQAYADYRAQAERNERERKRQEGIDRAITEGYLGALAKQDSNLAAARAQLRAVRLRVGACPEVSPGSGAAPAASGAATEGPDDESRMVDAGTVAERLAACDAVGARLNALIDWTQGQAADPHPPRQ